MALPAETLERLEAQLGAARRRAGAARRRHHQPQLPRPVRRPRGGGAAAGGANRAARLRPHGRARGERAGGGGRGRAGAAGGLEDPPCLVFEFVEGETMSAERLREPGRSPRSRRRCARSTAASRSPPASTPSAWSRTTPRRPASTAARSRPPTRRPHAARRGSRRRCVASSRLAPRGPLPQRPPRRQLHRRRRRGQAGRLGVRGDGRSLLRPRQLRRQQRARRRPRRRPSSAAYLERPPRAAELAALRLMRVMSDFREAMWGVVQQHRLRPRLRLRRLRRRALRRACSPPSDDPAFEPIAGGRRCRALSCPTRPAA